MNRGRGKQNDVKFSKDEQKLESKSSSLWNTQERIRKKVNAESLIIAYADFVRVCDNPQMYRRINSYVRIDRAKKDNIFNT